MFALQRTASNTMTFILFDANWVGIYGYLYTHSLKRVIHVVCSINSVYGLRPTTNSQWLYNSVQWLADAWTGFICKQNLGI